MSLACNSWNRLQTCISIGTDTSTYAYLFCLFHGPLELGRDFTRSWLSYTALKSKAGKNKMDFWSHLAPPTCAAGPSSGHHASTVPHIAVHLLLGPLMLWLVLFLFSSLSSSCFSRSFSPPQPIRLASGCQPEAPKKYSNESCAPC